MTETKPARGKKLLRAFGRAAARTGKWVGKGLLILSFTYVAMYGIFYAGRGERLTKAEKELLHGLYGNALDTDKIRKHQKRDSHLTHLLFTKKGMVLPPFNHIDFFGQENWSGDYAKDTSARLFGLFVHEAGHVLQNQTRRWNLKTMRYGYTLTDSSDYNRLGNEQQPEAMEDYATYFIHPSRAVSRHAPQDPAARAVFYERLKNMIERRFPHAKETRLKAEAARTPSPHSGTP